MLGKGTKTAVVASKVEEGYGMGRVYRWTPGVMALAVTLAVAACGGAADDRGPANTNVAAPATTQVVSDTTRAVVGDQVVALGRAGR